MYVDVGREVEFPFNISKQVCIYSSLRKLRLTTTTLDTDAKIA